MEVRRDLCSPDELEEDDEEDDEEDSEDAMEEGELPEEEKNNNG